MFHHLMTRERDSKESVQPEGWRARGRKKGERQERRGTYCRVPIKGGRIKEEGSRMHYWDGEEMYMVENAKANRVRGQLPQATGHGTYATAPNDVLLAAHVGHSTQRHCVGHSTQCQVVGHKHLVNHSTQGHCVNLIRIRNGHHGPTSSTCYRTIICGRGDHDT